MDPSKLTSADAKTLADSNHGRKTAVTPEQTRTTPRDAAEELPPPFRRGPDGTVLIGGLPYLH